MQEQRSRRLKVLTWHVHGSYLYYLSQTPHDFWLPTKPGRPHPFGGRTESFDFGPNVHEIDAEDVRNQQFDVILYQSAANYLEHGPAILSAEQQRLPRLFLEHDPPRQHPTDTRHWVDDPDVTVVHVTAFNRLMWDNGGNPTRVIDHGICLGDDVEYTGELPRGLVAINDLATRGRRLGNDIFARLRERLPLDLVGINSVAAGGLGEIPPQEFPRFASRYRFFFSPIRYTSLGLAVCEAMTIGLPVVALATAEIPSVIENGVNGFASNDIDELTEAMQHLLDDPGLAREIGSRGRETALRRFGIRRFINDWDAVFQNAADQTGPSRTALQGASSTRGTL
jgi:hypothetical protein